MDLVTDLVAFVRSLLGLPKSSPPSVPHFAIYPARVSAAAGDGSTVDLTPLDGRVPPIQGVRLLQPAGTTVVVKKDAVVLLGWEAGDPSKPYALPDWRAGAGVASIDVEADAITFVSSGAQPAARKGDTADGGTLYFIPGSGGATLTYVPPGTPGPPPPGTPIPLSAKIDSGSSKVGIGG